VSSEKMQLFGKQIIEELKKCGITHIVWLPCFQLGFIYDAMLNQDDIKLVPVAREGEGVAVLYQNTGIYESGDSMRLATFELKVPMLVMLGYRGWQGTDSAGVVMEPTMDAWHVKYHIMKDEKDIDMIAIADKEAQELQQPVALLIVGETPK
jgi:sulfopyruvate decarboxylase TPP-binding subunit